MRKKDKPKIIILIIIALMAVFFVVYKIISNQQLLVIREYTPLYDYSTKEKIIGASDYVFIGKVNKILRVEHENKNDKKYDYSPKTIYSVSVIKNIKRKLITDLPIEIKFDGGYDSSNKTLYLNMNLDLLNEDEYYIFLVYMDVDKGPLLVASKEQVISLGKEYKENNSLTKDYIKAYKNEEIPDATKYIIPKVLYTSIYDQNNK